MPVAIIDLLSRAAGTLPAKPDVRGRELLFWYRKIAAVSRTFALGSERTGAQVR
jgi:hypothetical protein